MEPSFWHERWNDNRIGFHLDAPNPLLLHHWPALQLPQDASVLVPLCGKTHDLDALAAMGHRVTGLELSPIAVRAWFEERGHTPRIDVYADHEIWSHENVSIVLGDALTMSWTETFDAVWDRAASVALRLDLRQRYAARLASWLKPGAKGLLVTFEYPVSEREGPPFAIPPTAVAALYEGTHVLTQMASDDLIARWHGAGHASPHPFGVTQLHEVTWMLERRRT